MRVARPMRVASAFLICAALVVTTGCKRGAGEQPTTVDTSGRGAPPGGQPLRYGTIDARPATPEAGFRVVRSAEEWGGSPLSVSFDQAMVLVASAGMANTGGYSINVQGVTRVNDQVHVQVVHTAPGIDCPVPQAAEWVGQVVAMERVDAPVNFHVVQAQHPPCVDDPVVAFECWAEGTELRDTSLRIPEPATIQCDATASRTDGGEGGPPTGGGWRLLAVPEGSSLTPGEFGQGPRATFTPDAPGPYPFEVSVTDAHGNTATANGTVVVGPLGEALEVRAAWDPATEGATVERPIILKVFKGSRACSLTGRGPPPWCTIEAIGEGPGAGTLIRLPVAVAGGEFEIVLDYPEGNDPEQAVAVITVTGDGAPIAEFRDTEQRSPRFRWDVATVQMPAGTVEAE